MRRLRTLKATDEIASKLTVCYTCGLKTTGLEIFHIQSLSGKNIQEDTLRLTAKRITV
jgi:hypothetical protein